MGGGCKKLFTTFLPYSAVSPGFLFLFLGLISDNLFSVLSVPRLFLFDVLGFLLSYPAFEGYRTGRRD